MLTQKRLMDLARIFAGLTFLLGCFWIWSIVGVFHWARKSNGATAEAFHDIDVVWISLMSVFFIAHLISSWMGAHTSIRGSVAMLGANILSLIGPIYLNVPVAPGPSVKAVLWLMVVALVVFLSLQISLAIRKDNKEIMSLEKSK